jgi:CheY-like chemotaxis protein
VEQVLRNLLSNAIKYTRHGSVGIRSCRIGERICIEVADTGIGIPQAQIPYIFDEFFQVGVASNATRDGYGLGLSIVLRIVRLLNSQLDVKSEVDKGSTFSLLLPSGKSQVSSGARGQPASSASEAKCANAQILLIEDDPAVRAATRMLLKVGGYRVLTAGTRIEALQIARAEAFDLLITDYHLAKEETGTQIIAELRQLLGPSLKAILMTGDTSSAVRDLGEDARLQVVSKPVEADQFLALIGSMLSDQH